MDPPNLPREDISADNLQDAFTELTQLNLEFMWDIEKMRRQIDKQDNSAPDAPSGDHLRQKFQQRIREYSKTLRGVAGMADTRTGHEQDVPRIQRYGHDRICSTLCEIPEKSIDLMLSEGLRIKSKSLRGEAESSNHTKNPNSSLNSLPPMNPVQLEVRSVRGTGSQYGQLGDKAILSPEEQVSVEYHPKQSNLQRPPLQGNNVLPMDLENEHHPHNPDEASYGSDFTEYGETDGNDSCSGGDDSCSEDDDNNPMQDVAYWGYSSDSEESRSTLDNIGLKSPLETKCHDTLQSSMSRQYNDKSNENEKLRHRSRLEIPDSARLREVRPRTYGANSPKCSSKTGDSAPSSDEDEDTIPTIDDTIPTFKRRNKPNTTNADHYNRYLNELKIKWEPLDEEAQQSYLKKHIKSWKCFYCQVTDHSGGCISQISNKMCITAARRGIPCQIVQFNEETKLYNWHRLPGTRVRLRLKSLAESYSFVCGNDDPAIEQQFLQKAYQTRSRCICCILLSRGRKKGDRCNLQRKIRLDQGKGGSDEGKGLFKACKSCQRTGNPDDCMVAVAMTRDQNGRAITYGLGMVSWKVEGVVNVTGPRFREDPPTQLPSIFKKREVVLTGIPDTTYPQRNESHKNYSANSRQDLGMTGGSSTVNTFPRTLPQARPLRRLPRPAVPTGRGRGHELFLERAPSFEQDRNIRPFFSTQEFVSRRADRGGDSHGGLGLLTSASETFKKPEKPPLGNGKWKRALSPDAKVNGDNNSCKMMRPAPAYIDKIKQYHKQQAEALKSSKPNSLPKPEARAKYKY